MIGRREHRTYSPANGRFTGPERTGGGSIHQRYAGRIGPISVLELTALEQSYAERLQRTWRYELNTDAGALFMTHGFRPRHILSALTITQGQNANHGRVLYAGQLL
jgi:hypothetical protein